jgi:hypothetical protein
MLWVAGVWTGGWGKYGEGKKGLAREDTVDSVM